MSFNIPMSYIIIFFFIHRSFQSVMARARDPCKQEWCYRKSGSSCSTEGDSEHYYSNPCSKVLSGCKIYWKVRYPFIFLKFVRTLDDGIILWKGCIEVAGVATLAGSKTKAQDRMDTHDFMKHQVCYINISCMVKFGNC